jgi:hypothetical protein
MICQVLPNEKQEAQVDIPSASACAAEVVVAAAAAALDKARGHASAVPGGMLLSAVFIGSRVPLPEPTRRLAVGCFQLEQLCTREDWAPLLHRWTAAVASCAAPCQPVRSHPSDL